MKSSIQLNSDKFAYSKKRNSSYLTLPQQQQIDYTTENEDNSFCKTPTNTCNSDVQCKFSLGVSSTNMIKKESQTHMFVNCSSNYQNQPILNYSQNHAYTMPQFPTNNQPVYLQNVQYHSMTSENLKASNFPTYHTQSDSNSASFAYMSSHDKSDQKNEDQNKKIFGLSNDFKLNPLNFHSLDTFGSFIRHSLNLTKEQVKEIISHPQIQNWVDRNKCHGFVYQTYPKIDGTKRKVPPVRCELCKFYGHLSHTCSIKDLLKSGACRCHICGQLGHPAEAGLCPYIPCSFCKQFGHWNQYCPDIEKVSKTLCEKCKRFGHTSEHCPDKWRQFDRISTFVQTPQKKSPEDKRPVYCYQCAKKGHYGHDCPDFYRKYFIRDNHQLSPVYFFSGSSPFVKSQIELNEMDKKLISHLVEQPLDTNFKPEQVDEDPLDQLEKFQAKIKSENNIEQIALFTNAHAEMPLKKYIRRWSNWVVDLHWLFTLQYFMESLPSPKLYYFIKNYPILDNFILHWMWWSYSLNKDIEIFTKDSFRAVGTTPWLEEDIKNTKESNVKVEAKVNVNKNNIKKKTSAKRKKNSKNCPIPKQLSKTLDNVPVKSDSENLKKFEKLINHEKKDSNEKNSNRKNKKTNRSNSTNEVVVCDSKKYVQKPPLQTDCVNESLDFQQTCEYLKGQLAQINYMIYERNSEFCSVNKGRSKSVDDEALKNFVQNGFKTRERHQVTVDHSNQLEDNLRREDGDHDSYEEQENSIFKDDELEKTLIDSSPIVSSNRDDSDKLELEVCEKKCEKIPEEQQALNGQIVILKEKRDDDVEVVIEVSQSSSSSSSSVLSSSTITKVVEESNAFEKFFKSFNTTLNSDEVKKQNAENYNKIVDLLKKSNQKQSIASNEGGLIITQNSPKPKVATELFKQESSSTQIPPPPPPLPQPNPVITISTSSITKKVTEEDENIIEDEKKEGPLISKQLVDTSSTDLIKLLLKIDSKKNDINKQEHHSIQTWSDAAKLPQHRQHVEDNLLSILKCMQPHSQQQQIVFSAEMLSESSSASTQINIDTNLSMVTPPQTTTTSSANPVVTNVNDTNKILPKLFSSSSSSSMFSSSFVSSSSSSSPTSASSATNSSTAKPGIESTSSTSLSSFNSMSSFKSSARDTASTSSLSSLSSFNSNDNKISANQLSENNDPSDNQIEKEIQKNENSGVFLKHDFENESKEKLENSSSFTNKSMSEKRSHSVSLSLNRSSTNSNNSTNSKSTSNQYHNKKFINYNSNSKKLNEESNGRRISVKNPAYSYSRPKSNYNISKNNNRGAYGNSCDHLNQVSKMYFNTSENSNKTNQSNNSTNKNSAINYKTNKNFFNYYNSATYGSTNVNSLMNLSQDAPVTHYQVVKSQSQQNFNKRKNDLSFNSSRQNFTTKINQDSLSTESKNSVAENSVNSNSQYCMNQLNSSLKEKERHQNFQHHNYQNQKLPSLIHSNSNGNQSFKRISKNISEEYTLAFNNPHNNTHSQSSNKINDLNQRKLNMAPSKAYFQDFLGEKHKQEESQKFNSPNEDFKLLKIRETKHEPLLTNPFEIKLNNINANAFNQFNKNINGFEKKNDSSPSNQSSLTKPLTQVSNKPPGSLQNLMENVTPSSTPPLQTSSLSNQSCIKSVISVNSSMSSMASKIQNKPYENNFNYSNHSYQHHNHNNQSHSHIQNKGSNNQKHRHSNSIQRNHLMNHSFHNKHMNGTNGSTRTIENNASTSLHIVNRKFSISQQGFNHHHHHNHHNNNHFQSSQFSSNGNGHSSTPPSSQIVESFVRNTIHSSPSSSSTSSFYFNNNNTQNQNNHLSHQQNYQKMMMIHPSGSYFYNQRIQSSASSMNLNRQTYVSNESGPSNTNNNNNNNGGKRIATNANTVNGSTSTTSNLMSLNSVQIKRRQFNKKNI